MFNQRRNRGFTLIELLVVIAVISLLSSVVLSSLSDARERGRIASARAQLDSIRTAIEIMVNDTGKWPGGCEQGVYESNINMALDDPRSGLVSQPTAGTVDGDFSSSFLCEWTSGDINEWSGPYVNTEELEDPWGNAYRIDTYRRHDYDECEIDLPSGPVIYSYGPEATDDPELCNGIELRLDQQNQDQML